MKRPAGTIVHRGPHLLLVSLAYAGLAILSVASAFVMRHRGHYVTPYEAPERIQHFFGDFPTAVRLGAFLLFGSSVPLGIFVATTVSQLKFLGVRAAGTKIALFGGLLSSFALALSGLSMWTLSVEDIVASQSLAHAIYFLSFLLGGVGFAVGFGLLAAGVSVTAGLTRKLPRSVVIFGLLIAIAGEFSSLSLLLYPASFLLPITRFGGIIWLILVATKLPRVRKSRSLVPSEEVTRA
jgi:hypothetical protein